LIVRSNENVLDWIQQAVTLVVEPGDFYGTGRMPPASHSGVLLEQEWTLNGSKQ
jgi:lipopolysaccharide transport system ATP-binding protein